MFQKKEQDKTPEGLREDRQSTQERFQINDCKDYQRTWEKNGCTEQEVRFLIRVRNCNKQSEMKNTINEMKNILEESVVD